MKTNVEERAVQLGQYIAKNGATVRLAAKKYNVSKSTVHKDVSERLKQINMALYKEVRKVLDTNKEERHIEAVLPRRKNTRILLKKLIKPNKSG